MSVKKIIYHIGDFFWGHGFEKKINDLLKKKKKLVIFDVGCYRGFFTKNILKVLGQKKYKFYLFDVNKNVKKYISDLIKIKNINYNEVAISDKNGKADYYFNRFYEPAGSSLSKIIKNDTKWNFSRRLLLKTLLLNSDGFIKYKVPTITLDNFLKKNKINYVDVLKIDIEGAEFNLLKGATKTLAKNKIHILLIEIVGKKEIFEKKEKKIINFLEKRHFTLIQKANIFSISLFSNLKGGDYLLVNKKYDFKR